MVKLRFLALLIAASLIATPVALAGQGRGQRGTQGGAPPNRTATGFGTTNTLTTIPEAGAGSAADDPTAEQLAASPEAQAIIANAKKIAGTDLARDANAFCTWNGAADVPSKNPSFGMVQVYDNLYYAGTGSVGALLIKTNA